MVNILENNPERLQELLSGCIIMLMASGRVVQSVNFIKDLKESIESCEKIFDLIENEDYSKNETEKTNLTDLGDIEFKDVEFR